MSHEITPEQVASTVDAALVQVDELKSIGLSAGLDAVGVTTVEPFTATLEEILRRREAGLHGGMQFTFRNPERSTDPRRILQGASSILVGAMRVPAPRLPGVRAGRARIAAYARNDYYGELRRALGEVATHLTTASYAARVVADENALVDRAAAVRAGIGWYGRNGNVLIPGRGSWFVLGSVITDAPLQPDQEITDEDCGTCRSCIDGCPTGAIVESGVVDARRCLAWLVQAPGDIPLDFRKAMGGRIYGCDDCQEVCPVGRPERPVRRSTEPSADVEAVEVLTSSDGDLLDRFGHWYIADRDPRYLRRNALVVLGNTADPSDHLVARVLKENIAGNDPMLHSHAVWAVQELGRSDLLEKPNT
ncbi:MAG TPA: tRNA epoxyqueuosine(34) reductase QueG [Acidimicrobiaceae bacterium]|mgnify:FL=1|nr:tRNA epoxyqueuosine(34) reductase QueG [Acidimicrobiaceae bacterium]HCV35885.1 tRNA epoxyqueuosine(34) reductase QueG [Acidimicrobiaceae bacterium]HJO80505.1 tRNA epoxyqueuosine(34) reductase QueG [Acidimicrobiales bacterium]